MFLQIIKLLGSVKLTGYLHNFVYSQTLTQVFSKLFEFSKFKSYIAVEFFGLLIYTSTQQDSSSTLHIFIFHIFSSHISFSNYAKHVLPACVLVFLSFPNAVSFVHSILGIWPRAIINNSRRLQMFSTQRKGWLAGTRRVFLVAISIRPPKDSAHLCEPALLPSGSGLVLV